MMDHSQQLIELLARGEVCVIPTDTVYGIVGKLSMPSAVARIYKLKQRDITKPVGTILAASLAQVAALTTPSALALAAEFWPGPTSIIVPATEAYDYAHKGQMSLAVRIPADIALRALLVQTGPLATSSANLQGRPLATTISMAQDYFGDAVALHIDGGDLADRAPSRIIRIDSDNQLTTVRP